MAIVKTDQGDFELCDCGKPLGHVGPVWHPELDVHPSGAKMVGEQPEDTAALLAAFPAEKKMKLEGYEVEEK